ncbi:porin [Microvirga puerhi]|uniref:Porin n=1 Tax=Microvirga puerhi TaxID=2876078 RepID=A0ABS7VJZ1_9HYPH|nr:porin [Microvirga puerhi]MBZ6075481.1 porin [Microvirga puerhi]
MKLAQSLLFGSLTGLAFAAGAQAADLPAKKAAPVEYVRVCTTYGEGFFYIPGTETCLRVGGRVRAEYMYAEPIARRDDAFGFYARGRIQLDARTATAYGLLRSVVRFEITRTSGTPFNGVPGTITTSPNVAEAFVQFGGLTAGRVVSFFSNGDLATEHFGTLRFDDAPDVNLLAYTFTFGGGFSASISLEDGLDRRRNDFIPGGLASSELLYGGQRAPDLVGNLKYDGTWGTAQLSGAVHQIRSNNLVTLATPFGTAANYPDTEYGFAAAAYLGVNLPQLAPGDALWLAATYTNGALAYMDGGNAGLNSSPFNAITVNGGVGLVDAYINPLSGNIERGHGWSIAGGLRHYWTPTVRQSIFGSYMRVAYGAGASTVTTDGFVTGLTDFNEWRLGSNVIWSPVSGLDLGVEVMYARVDPRNRVLLPTGQALGSDSGWEGRLRIQRDF